MSTGVRPSWQQGFARNAGESRYPDLWRGLAGAWVPGLGMTADKWYDVSGNGNHGTINGYSSSKWFKSQPGFVYDFELDDGTNWVDMGDAGLLEGQGEFTLASYVKIETIASDQALLWRATNGFSENGSIALFFDDTDGGSGFDDIFKFVLRTSGPGVVSVVSSNTSVAIDVWYHVVGVARPGQQLQLYVNGIEDSAFQSGTLNASWSLENTAQPLRYGAASDSANRLLDGRTNSAMIWHRSLMPDEIKQLANAPLCMFETVEDSDHLPLFVAAAAGGGNIPEMVHNMRRRQVA